MPTFLTRSLIKDATINSESKKSTFQKASTNITRTLSNRSSELEMSHLFENRHPIRGFFTLFWVAMTFYYSQTIIKTLKATGQPIGTAVIWLISETSLELIVSDVVMLSFAFLCFPIQYLFAHTVFGRSKFVRISIQSIYELAFIIACTYYCINTDWYASSRGSFYLHSLVMLMKVHSYNAKNQEYLVKRQTYMKLKPINKSKDSQKQLNSLRTEFSTTNLSVSYPANLTLFNYFDYLLIPSLCYNIEFPRGPKIRWFYVLEKLFAAFVLAGLTLISIEHHIYPIMEESNLSILETLVYLCPPILIITILVFYVMFECVCNGFAELTRYSDRNFYEDWWNSITFYEFSYKWNRPVHLFLKNFVYKEFLKTGKFTKVSALTLTFLVSSIFHELAMGVIFKKFICVFIIFQMSQIPITFIMTLPIFKTRAWLGNAIFWFGLGFGIPMLFLIYFHVQFI